MYGEGAFWEPPDYYDRVYHITIRASPSTLYVYLGG